MAGQLTHGYDVVMELSEQTYEDILRVIFDTDDFLLNAILGPLGIPVPPGIGFDATVSFDRPPGLPAAATDPIDIRVTLGPGGSTGSLRIVADVVTDRFSPTVEVIRLDLANKLWLTEISVVGINLPGLNGAFANLLRSSVQSIILLALPADAATTDGLTIRDVDARIVDDTSSADRDASALMLTFGGGTAGDRTAFTQSFLTGDGDAGLMASMDWICRNISPAIDKGLGDHGAFRNCRLEKSIDMGDGVSLTQLSVTAADGHLDVKAAVTKSGFCYTATGTVSARVTVNVSGGELHVDLKADDPDLDVDIPFLCYLAAAVLGALGGALIGAVYAVIGGILLPTIIYLGKEVLEGAVNGAAETVAGVLNSSLPAVDLTVPEIAAPVIDVDFQFSDAAIDDIEIAGHMAPVDTAPVRVAGQATIPNGRVLDLDSGRVDTRDLPSADLGVVGTGNERRLTAVCGAAMARTTLAGIDDIFRAAVYPWNYTLVTSFPLSEAGLVLPLFGFISLNKVYGFRTNEGRWSAIQVTDASNSSVTVRYVTWEKPEPTVQIAGAFSCSKARFDLLGAIDVDAVFESSGFLRSVRSLAERGPLPELVHSLPELVHSLPELVHSLPELVEGSTAPTLQIARSAPSALDAAAMQRVKFTSAAILTLPTEARTIGTFTRTLSIKRVPFARFRATTAGFGSGLRARWEIDGIGLDDTAGSITTPGGTPVHYTASGTSLALDVTSSVAVEMRVSVTVVDDQTRTASAQRCVRFEPTCTRVIRTTPTFEAFRGQYLKEFGIVATQGAPVIG
ncbi:hypothetical protein ACWDTI_13055 [Gordonia sp. NPDC003424]